MANEMTLRDMFAAQALLGLMHHWEKFDEDGCLGSRKDNVTSLAQQAIVHGWGSDHPDEYGVISLSGKQSYAKALADDAYFIADAMMEAREVKEQCEPQPDPKETDLDQMKHYWMVGGPKHGEYFVYRGVPPQYFSCGIGQYLVWNAFKAPPKQ